MNNFTLVNADTDSITICKADSSEITLEERIKLLDELNSLFPNKIHWEDDGYYTTVIVVKAKNYILWDGTKLKYKGSAIKASTKEPALKEFIKRLIDSMLNDRNDYQQLYNEYVKEILDVKDIKRWVTRKTITSKVLDAKRTNEQRVLDAIKGTEYTEGDRAYFFFKEDGNQSLLEHFDGKYNKVKLLEKLFKTTLTFKTVLDVETLFPNYKLKRNKELLDALS